MIFDHDQDSISPDGNTPNLTLGGKAVAIPMGSTIDRPTGGLGLLRFNTDTNKFETYQTTEWKNLILNSAANGSVQISDGGTGLTTLGTSNQFLSVNPTATSLEYKTIVGGAGISVVSTAGLLTIASTGGGTGTVTNVSIVSANGFAGTVSNPTTTPAITLSTSVTGILVGNGTSVTTAVSGTDVKTINGVSILGSGNLVVSGTATPAGADTQIQYNNAGAFGASSNLTWDNAINTFFIGGTDADVIIQSTTNPPAASPVDSLRCYSQAIANFDLLHTVNEFNEQFPLSPHFASRHIGVILPNQTSTATNLGMPYTSHGTFSGAVPATTNTKTHSRRAINTSGNGAGSFCGLRTPIAQVWRGDAPDRGGFFLNIRTALETIKTGIRAFHGLSDRVAAPTNVDPLTSTVNNRVGMAINTNTGNWNLIHGANGSAPTVIALGANFPVDTTTVYDMYLYAPPNSATIYYHIVNLATNNKASGTLSTNLPANNVFLGVQYWLCNNTAGIVALSMNRIYLESPT